MTQDKLDVLADSCWEEHNGLNTFNHVKFAALVAAYEKKFWMEQIEVECNEAVLAERVRMCKQFNIPMELANETAESNETD